MKTRFVVFTFAFTASMLLALSVYAQSPSALKADIPFDFSAGSAVLPAGQYVVKPASLTNRDVTMILGKDKNSRVLVLTLNFEDWRNKDSDTGKLVFHRYGDHYFLARIIGPGEVTGKELMKSKAETEIARSTTTVQTIAVAAILP